jgi:lipoate synthase
VFDARPEVFAHNVETVPRIFKRIRPAFRYDRSLDVLTQARAPGLVTKSNLILGMGETREEISQALRRPARRRRDLLTITQYLRPSPRCTPIDRWVTPEEFEELEERRQIGYAGVLVRAARAFVVPRRPASEKAKQLPAGREAGRPASTQTGRWIWCTASSAPWASS